MVEAATDPAWPTLRSSSPTVPPPQPRDLGVSLTRNIDALTERRQVEEKSATRQERLAKAVTNFTGSMIFVYVHLVVYGVWIAVNSGIVAAIPKFDPSFVILATEASVEAIFLSTFVLISQNRSSAAADKRADLDLHINLLAEHELTKLAELVVAMAERLDVRLAQSPEIREIQRDVAPEAVLDEIEAKQARGG